MLPGFRLSLVAAVIAVAVVIFGFGTAGLLRVAHERFAALAEWRAEFEPFMASRTGERLPGAGEAGHTLAVLQIDPPMAQPIGTFTQNAPSQAAIETAAFAPLANPTAEAADAKPTAAPPPPHTAALAPEFQAAPAKPDAARAPRRHRSQRQAAARNPAPAATEEFERPFADSVAFH